ncbi:hypothetical protein [Rhodococcus gannanensis]|uniref:Mce-associated membrane protein n=1 Tax=Rhodococcus gannanensis TaxID=1960308 RepID=A0ABW4PB33_9NOCA
MSTETDTNAPTTGPDPVEPDTTETDDIKAATDVGGDDGPDADDVDSAEAARDRGWSRRIGIIALIVVTVASLACAVVIGWMLKNAHDVDSAAEQARATARNYAVTLTSVDSGDLDKNFDDVLAGATGEFKDMYSESSEQLKQLLVDNSASATGTVVDDGIKSATKTKVEVLLFVDQTVTNSVTPEPRLDRSRVVMTMELVDGQWLASKVDLP